MNSGDCVCKIKHGNVLRRIRIARLYERGQFNVNMTFSRLEETVRRLFKLPETFKFDMVYTDKDGDEVTMFDDSDIRDAVIYQDLETLRLTVVAQESERSPLDDHSRERRDRIVHSSSSSQALTSDPPSWAADIILKLDQLLLAVNEGPVELGVDSVNTTKSTRAWQHLMDEVDDSPNDVSTIKPAKDVLPGEEWTDIAQTASGLEFLRRAMILRQRGTTDELND